MTNDDWRTLHDTALDLLDELDEFETLIGKSECMRPTHASALPGAHRRYWGSLD